MNNIEQPVGSLAEYQKQITQAPDDRVVTDLTVLRQQCRLTSLKELEKINFVKRVKAALNHTWTNGYGMAAIQIGIPIQAAWFRVPVKQGFVEKLLFNPIVLKTEGVIYFPGEGCLSVPHTRVTTKRARCIKVKNGDGEVIEARDLLAVVIQHEIGHMNGELCIDHATKSEEIPGRNDPCSCGSGKKFKKCCIL